VKFEEELGLIREHRDTNKAEAIALISKRESYENRYNELQSRVIDKLGIQSKKYMKVH